MEAKPVKSQVFHQMLYKEGRQRGQNAVSDAERANRSNQCGNQAARLRQVRKSSNRILMTIIKKHARNPLQVAFQLIQLALSLRGNEHPSPFTHGVPHIAAVLSDTSG